MPARRLYVWFALWIVALSVGFYALPGVSMYTWAVIGLSSAVAVLVGVRQHRPSNRLPWFLLSGALAAFATGDTTYNILTDYLGQKNPFPSIADAFYLIVYPLLAAALLIFIRARSGGDNRAALLDALLPTAGLGLLSWVFLIAPYVHNADLTLWEKLTSIAYPLGDVLALAMMLRLITAPGRKPTSGGIITFGVTSLLITDVLYGLRQLAGTWAVGGPTDSGWVIFYAAIGLAALHPSMTELTASESRPRRALVGGRRIVAMAAASMIAPAVLLVEGLEGRVTDAAMIAAACGLMFLLVMARVTGLLRTQRETATRERTLRIAGSALIAASTSEEATAALRKAVADLVPDGEPYRFQLLAVPGRPESTGGPRRVAVAELPANVANSLAGFTSALLAEVGTGGHRAGGIATPGHAILAADSSTLDALRQPFEALVALGAMTFERIDLTAEINRRSTEDYFRTLIQSASDVILIVDEEDRIRYASPSADAVFGRADLVGSPFTSLIAPVDHPQLRQLLAHLRASGIARDGVDLTAVRVDDRLLQVECSYRDLRHEPTVAGLVFTIRDVTERRRLEVDLAHQAFHDALTGLANRALFLDRLRQAALLAENTGTLIGVLLIDLDDFKEVNDSLGHGTGDQLLIAVGRRISDAVGPYNTTARTGGDEFAVLVEHLHAPSDADELAAGIVRALAEPIELNDGAGGCHLVSGAASVGIATSGEAADIAELQQHADIAMYSAKAEGKNTWQRYQDHLHTLMLQRLELRNALNDAVSGGQLRLRFQPIVELETDLVVGVEALVRWQHPTRGLLGPTEFIELAEENGTVVAIGGWVLEESLRTFVNWRTAAPDSPLHYISVNVSPRQFRSPGFVDQVRGALSRTGARPEWLLLEITESLLLHDADQVRADLRALRALGVRVAIDDFGTGYSSLSYLRQMPVDVLKIDKSFIDDILASERQLAMVEAIVSLALTLRLDIVAEGIESREHRDVLVRLGCPHGQGFLFSPPVSAAECHPWIHRRATALSS